MNSAFQRSVDKNTAQLKTLQAERKEAATEAMRQAKLLLQLAQAEGKPYQPEAYFTTAPLVRESVFSTAEVTRELTRKILLDHAIHHWPTAPAPPVKPLQRPQPVDPESKILKQVVQVGQTIG